MFHQSSPTDCRATVDEIVIYATDLQPLRDRSDCPACHRIIEPHWKFCAHCGKPRPRITTVERAEVISY